MTPGPQTLMGWRLASPLGWHNKQTLEAIPGERSHLPLPLNCRMSLYIFRDIHHTLHCHTDTCVMCHLLFLLE